MKNQLKVSNILKKTIDGMDGYSVSGYYGIDTNIVIPNYVNGLPVVGIEQEAFSSSYLKDSIENIIIPNSVLRIGNNAFAGLTEIKSLTLPENLKFIGENAFIYCNLKEIFIPKNVIYVGKNAFIGNNDISIFCEASTKPSSWSNQWNSYNAIEVWHCEKMKVVEGNYEYALTKDNKAYIKKYTGSEIDVNIPSKLGSATTHSILPNAFSDNGIIQNINICDSVVHIYSSAFTDLVSIKDIVLPLSVNVIDEHAFDLDEGSRIFTTASAKMLNWDENFVSSDTKVIFSYGGNKGSFNNLEYYCLIDNGNKFIVIDKYIGSDSNLEIPEIIENITVKTINNSAFKDNTSLVSIVIADTVEIIGESAFEGCTSLQTVTLPSSLAAIQSYTFFNCSSLININIGSNVLSIGQYSFVNCSSLSTLFIPKTVIAIEKYAIYNCVNLNIYCEPTIRPTTWDVDWAKKINSISWGNI